MKQLAKNKSAAASGLLGFTFLLGAASGNALLASAAILGLAALTFSLKLRAPILAPVRIRSTRRRS